MKFNLVGALLLVAFSTQAEAEVYKHVDEDGRVTYSTENMKYGVRLNSEPLNLKSNTKKERQEKQALARARPEFNPSKDRPWSIEGSYFDSTTLPKNYRGSNAKKLIEFISSVEQFTQKEFETKEAFDQRKNKELAKIEGKRFAFRLHHQVPSAYDIDQGVFTIKSQNTGCVTKQSLVCKSAESPDMDGYFIDIGGSLPDQDFVKNKNGSFGFLKTMEMATERAKSLRQNTIALLFIGKVEPKVSYVYSKYDSSYSIPVSVESILLYVFETGEILSRYEMPPKEAQ